MKRTGTPIPGYRIDKSGKLVPIKYKISRPAEYARKTKRKWKASK